jgi:hypothetical protein
MSGSTQIFSFFNSDTSHLISEIPKKGVNMTVATFLAILLKVLSNPALIAGLIAFLQKVLHP